MIENSLFICGIYVFKKFIFFLIHFVLSKNISIFIRFINRLLAESRIYFSEQEEICEKPEFTGVNEDFEQITDELRGLKTKIMQEV
ncbi:MAG: hypothetical protein BGO68_03740 [Candidatus Amoebophilus sp. 36-38]|nr:MAG: hypothetical protein BGO68_03740 [Candidatus Amoebophilus sp. 36-38]